MASQAFRLLYPPGASPQGAAMPDYDFVRALQIDRMVSVRRESFRGIPDLALEQFFSCDPAVLAYRADVVTELADTPALYALVCDALPLIRDVYDMRRVLNSAEGSLESGLASTRYLEMYLELTELFRSRLAGITPRSEGLRRLKAEIDARCGSEEYRCLREHLARMEHQIGHVKSITLGLNIDGTLQVTEAGLLHVNTTRYRQGSIMDRLLGRGGNDPMVCMSGFAHVAKAAREEEKNALNSAVLRALDTVFAKTVRSWEPVIDKYFHDETTFFIDLMDDLRFLTAAVQFVLELHRLGCPTCRPEIRPTEEKMLRLQGVYNPMLAIKTQGAGLVSNDFCFDEQGRFYLVTGPNHGGKSIFCYSVGMAQALFQLGLPVPAQSAIMSPVTGIYTHFPASDEDNYGKGRLESECARISAILTRLRETDLLLMDESFSSTSLLEGSCIAGEVLRAVAMLGCGGLYVTHIHELTRQLAQFNDQPGRKGRIDNLAAQMQCVADGTRSYRVVRAAPDGLSYARDIAQKYGLSCEDILQRNRDAQH
ncbi:MAG: hypothetical protein ACI4OL_05090 [Gemmiger sp.]